VRASSEFAELAKIPLPNGACHALERSQQRRSGILSTDWPLSAPWLQAGYSWGWIEQSTCGPELNPDDVTPEGIVESAISAWARGLRIGACAEVEVGVHLEMEAP
jgi:hypothetical protein